MAGQILTPNSVGLPMGVQLQGLETPTGLVLETRRDRFVLAALQALVARESATLLSGAALAQAAVSIADATLAAMDAQRIVPATSPVSAPPPAVAGS